MCGRPHWACSSSDFSEDDVVVVKHHGPGAHLCLHEARRLDELITIIDNK